MDQDQDYQALVLRYPAASSSVSSLRFWNDPPDLTFALYLSEDVAM